MEHSVSFQVRDHQFIQLGLTSILGEGDDDGICSPLYWPPSILIIFSVDFHKCCSQICGEYEIIARPLIVISECG